MESPQCDDMPNDESDLPPGVSDAERLTLAVSHSGTGIWDRDIPSGRIFRISPSLETKGKAALIVCDAGCRRCMKANSQVKY